MNTLFKSGFVPGQPSSPALAPVRTGLDGTADSLKAVHALMEAGNEALEAHRQAFHAFRLDDGNRQALQALEQAGREIVQAHRQALRSLPSFSFQA